MPQVELGGQQISYQVVISHRAKQLRFRISRGVGLEAVLPATLAHTSPDWETLIKNDEAWILRVLGNLEENPPLRFEEGEKLCWQGQDYTLRLLPNPHLKAIKVFGPEGSTFKLGLPPHTPPAAIRTALQKWYTQAAQAYLPGQVGQIAGALGFEYERVSIRDQKARWGSCSIQGVISLNWRLMMARPAAQDYLIIHELCHLQEMNHSPRFWALVKQHCPDHKAQEKWLRAHEARFFSF
jgi:predicted metal-dependent hydrolase